MQITKFIVLNLVLMFAAASCSQKPPAANTAETKGSTSNSPQAGQNESPVESFARGTSPPELEVEAHAVEETGSPYIEFSGVMKDSDMVSVAQFRLARKQDGKLKPDTSWMALSLAGGQWNEQSGKFTGRSMQHMNLGKGIYSVIIRAEDSNGAVRQVVSNEVEIK